MKRLNPKLLLLLVFILITSIFSLNAQKDLGIESINPFLEKMAMDFYKPTENQAKFTKPRKNEFFHYDTKIKFKSNEMEVLIAFHPANEGPLTTHHPHLEFNRLLGNLVPNDDDQEVLVVGWREDKLTERNADWGAEAYMKARKEITNFPFAKLISFFKEDQGMIVMLYCFDKPDSLPNLLTFEGDKIK